MKRKEGKEVNSLIYLIRITLGPSSLALDESKLLANGKPKKLLIRQLDNKKSLI